MTESASLNGTHLNGRDPGLLSDYSEAFRQLRQGRPVVIASDGPIQNGAEDPSGNGAGHGSTNRVNAWLAMAAADASLEGLQLLQDRGTGPLLLCMPREQLPRDLHGHHQSDTSETTRHNGSGAPVVAVQLLADWLADGQYAGRPPAGVALMATPPGGAQSDPGHLGVASDLARHAGLGHAVLIRQLAADAANPVFGQLPRVDPAGFARRVRAISPGSLKPLPATARVPIRGTNFQVRLYEHSITGQQHVAIMLGDLSLDQPVLARLHSECFTGDILGSLRCDCGPQLDTALDRIIEAGRGVVLYLRQEGRGVGLHNKLLAYVAQDRGLDTVEANRTLGLPSDFRDYGCAAEMLKDIGVREVVLMTNNPAKIASLETHGIRVRSRLDLSVGEHQENRFYLATKRQKMGHVNEEGGG